MTQELENFYRLSTVIVDETKDSFLHLLDFHLTNQGITLQRFIEINGHYIYHMCFNSYPCCLCPPGTRTETRGSRVIQLPQLDILFDKTGSKLPIHFPRSKSTPYCCCPVNSNIKLQDLDFTLARLLLVNFTTLVPQGSPERNALDYIVNARNHSFAHAKVGRISNSEYLKSMSDIEKSLLVLAKVYGKEDETKQRLRDIAKQPINSAICLQLQNTLLQQCQIDETIKQLLGEKKLPDCLTTDLYDVTVTEGCDAHFEIRTKECGLYSLWLQDGIEIVSSEKFVPVMSGKIHSLDIRNTCLFDKGLYTVRIEDIERNAHLYVEEYFTKNPQSVECLEGDTAEFTCEVKGYSLPACWYKTGILLKNDAKYEILQAGKIHRLSIKKCDLRDTATYTVSINNRVRETSLVVIEYFTKNPQSVECLEGDTAEFTCEVKGYSLPACWYKTGILLKNDAKYEILEAEKIHRLSIKKCDLRDTATYTVSINNRVRETSLVVIEYFTKPLGTMTCLEGETVQFECEVLDNYQSALWFKDGIEVRTSDKYKVESDGRLHRLVISNTKLDDQGEYTVQIKHCIRWSQLIVQEMPTAIQPLSNEVKQFYMEMIRSGTETRLYMPIVIIGENGAGKTCLLRRLLRQGISGVESTDSIDIHKCKIRLSDGQWIVNEELDRKKEVLSRIKVASLSSTIYDMTSIAERLDSFQLGTDPQYYDYSELSPHTSFKHSSKRSKMKHKVLIGERRKLGDELPKKKKTNVLEDFEVEMESPIISQPKNSLTEILDYLDDLLNGIENVDIPTDKFAECGILDFAGEKDYYATHPIFLNPNALHVLVVNIMKDVKPITTEHGFDKIGEYIDFWLDTIHSYGVMEEAQEEMKTEFLDPPVIIVCTRIDECRDHLQERKDDFRRQLLSVLSNEIKKKHVREICFVSNTESSEEDFSYLRNTIFKYGRQLRTFGEKLPLRWIQLEQLIDVLRQCEMNILSWPYIVELSLKCSIDDEKEIQLFLKYQHQVGGVIYFENLKENIILNQKWLANAFRCLLSAKFDSNLKLTYEWKTLQDTGKLEPSLIIKLFDKEPELDFNKHRDHILNVMELFGIIVRITTLMENGQRCILPTYYMPCMISGKASFTDIIDMFNAKKDKCKLTPWLCIEFDFMPFDFFNHILCYYISRYPICTEPRTGRIAIYHGMGVFFLDKTRFTKFILCFCKNTIALQIWQWKNLEKGTCKAMLEELKAAICRVKDRFNSRRVSYIVKLKCSDGNIHMSDGRHSYSELLDLEDEYFCEEHSNSHKIQDFFLTWFEDYTENKEYKFKGMRPSRIGTVMNVNLDTTEVSLPINRSEGQMTCIKHTKTIKQFCSTHKEPICDVCFKEKHNTCSLTAIKTALATVGQVKENIKANIERELKLLKIMETDMLANQEILMAALEELGEKKKNFEEILANVNDVKFKNLTLEHLIDMYNLQRRMKKSVKNFHKFFQKTSLSTIKEVNLGFKDLQNTSVPFPLGENIFFNMSLQLKTKTSLDIALKTKYPYFVRGCTFCSNDEVCLVDTANDCIFIVYLNERPELTASKKNLKCIPLPGRPFDVINCEKHLMVTLRQHRAIGVIEQTSLESPKINVKQVVFRGINCGSVGGISRFGDELAVVIECFGFYILDQSGGVKAKIQIKDSINLQYVCYYNKKLHYTKLDENYVYCCDKEGNNLWMFQDRNLKSPTGITVDEAGNVFVAGLYSNNVVVISPDGKFCKEILSSRTDISQIRAIDYNFMTKTLLVCSENGHVHLYSVWKNS